jgi:hypothetical protein
MSSVVKRTSELLQDRRVTERPLEPGEIALLVDIHAPPARPEDLQGWGGGFDADVLGSTCLRDLVRRDFRAYGFLGSVSERSAPRSWQLKARRLAENYPGDGANFCALWQRPA